MEGRGADGMYSKHDTNYRDMGVSKATYYRIRDDLLTLGVLEATRRFDATSIYRVNQDVLLSLSETDESHCETPESQPETSQSHCETRESHSAETKNNTKKNMKDNIEEEQEESACGEAASASAPTAILVDKRIPIGEVGPIQEQPAWPESHCETELVPAGNVWDSENEW